MKASKWQKTFDFVFDNIVDITTIGVALALVIRHNIYPFEMRDFGTLATWILACLGLLAISGLWDRNRKLKKLEAVLAETKQLIGTKVGSKVTASNFFSTLLATFDNNTFSSAKVIYICGITLTRTTRQYMQILSTKIASGAEVRFMLIDPASPAVMGIMASRSMGNTTAEYWRTRIETVVDVINAIAIRASPSAVAEIGYLPFIPSFGLILTDPDTLA